MDVFVIPIGSDRYELYCEFVDNPDAAAELPATGVLGRLRRRFTAILRAVEVRQQGAVRAAESSRWLARAQDRIVGWVAERLAEQRLLWNLRRETAVTTVHPEDMTFDQAMTLVRRILERDRTRHTIWLVVDTLGLAVSAVLAPLPGPNIVAYYFVFRVVGHWLSIRGAAQGLRRVIWSGTPCPPLSELRRAAVLEPQERERRVHDIAARLRLQHLPTFFERVAITRA